jgi:hypothetical protein
MMNDDRSWDELSDAEKRFRMLIFDVYVMGLTFDLLNMHVEDATETMREFSRALISHHAGARGIRGRGAPKEMSEDATQRH